MSIRLAKRVQRIKPSATLAVTARAARLRADGKDIIGLGAGEPDFDTPVHIADAGVAAIREGHTRYTNVDGTIEHRQTYEDHNSSTEVCSRVGLRRGKGAAPTGSWRVLAVRPSGAPTR